MKKIFTFFLITLISLNLVSQNENRGLCIVDKIKFKEVYVMCEPIRPYEVVGEVYSLLSQLYAESSAKLNEDIPDMKTMIDNLVVNAINKEEKGKVKNFDAIMTNDGLICYLIKFKEGNEDKSMIGRVKQILGKDVFVMCTPLNSYDMLGEVFSFSKQIMAVNQSIENYMKILVENAITAINIKYPSIEFDAIIATASNKAYFIKYK